LRSENRLRPAWAGTLNPAPFWNGLSRHALIYTECKREVPMNGVIYLVGLVVVVLAILSFFGLR